jgi:hypothetical protein
MSLRFNPELFQLEGRETPAVLHGVDVMQNDFRDAVAADMAVFQTQPTTTTNERSIDVRCIPPEILTVDVNAAEPMTVTVQPVAGQGTIQQIDAGQMIVSEGIQKLGVKVEDLDGQFVWADEIECDEPTEERGELQQQGLTEEEMKAIDALIRLENEKGGNSFELHGVDVDRRPEIPQAESQDVLRSASKENDATFFYMYGNEPIVDRKVPAPKDIAHAAVSGGTSLAIDEMKHAEVEQAPEQLTVPPRAAEVVPAEGQVDEEDMVPLELAPEEDGMVVLTPAPEVAPKPRPAAPAPADAAQETEVPEKDNMRPRMALAAGMTAAIGLVWKGISHWRGRRSTEALQIKGY